MDCRILRQITLKADGHLCCDDSMGYEINLGHVNTNPGWRVTNILNSPIYKHIRTSFANGTPPWPGTCEGCDLYSPGVPANDSLSKKVSLLIEPTLACHLNCPSCRRKYYVGRGQDTTPLSLDIFSTLLKSLADSNIEIEEISYVGWGEPLLHGNFPELYNIGRKYARYSTQVLTTSGCVDFNSTIGNAAPDRIVVSCDGAFDESYKKYRINGNLQTVIKFMRDCKNHGKKNIHLQWKYILFEHNDSTKEIIEAQRIAKEVGVDSMVFIITNSKWKSESITSEKFSEFPITNSFTTLQPAAAMNTTLAEAAFKTRHGQGNSIGNLDRCTLNYGKFLTIEGWALSKTNHYVPNIFLEIDGRNVDTTPEINNRLDVLKAHPNAEGSLCGYKFSVPLPHSTLPSEIVIKIQDSNKVIDTYGGSVNWSGKAEDKRKDLPIWIKSQG